MTGMPAAVACSIGCASAAALVAATTMAVGFEEIVFSMMETSPATSVSAVAPSFEICTPNAFAAASAPSNTVAQYCDVVALTITTIRPPEKSAADAGGCSLPQANG